MRREGVVDQKRKEEAEFTQWVNASPERKAKYGEVLPSLQKAYDELNKTQPRDTLLGQLLSVSDLFQIAAVIAANAAEKISRQRKETPASRRWRNARVPRFLKFWRSLTVLRTSHAGLYASRSCGTSARTKDRSDREEIRKPKGR